MTEKVIRETCSNYDVLRKVVEEMAHKILAARGSERRWEFSGFTCEDDTLYINIEEYYRGDTDYDTLEVPLSYLWTPNYEEIERAE